MVFSFIFIILAAICNALMDKVENEIQYNTSIFRRFKTPEFWCKTKSAHSVNLIPGTTYRPDAWHISKSLMIIFLIAAIVMFTPSISTHLKPFFQWYVLMGTLIEILLFGTIWNVTFNLFYNKFFKSI